jgi:hypothetical protein
VSFWSKIVRTELPSATPRTRTRIRYRPTQIAPQGRIDTKPAMSHNYVPCAQKARDSLQCQRGGQHRPGLSGGQGWRVPTGRRAATSVVCR